MSLCRRKLRKQRCVASETVVCSFGNGGVYRGPLFGQFELILTGGREQYLQERFNVVPYLGLFRIRSSRSLVRVVARCRGFE